MNITAADTVLTNGVIYTADSEETVCEAVAVKGNYIVFVGSAVEAQRYIGEHTEIIDLRGKMLIPGFLDTHIHPPGLSLVEMYQVQLSHLQSLDEYLAAVEEFLRQNPNAKIVYGRGWSWGAFSGMELTKGPRKEHLDAISTDIPIVLRAADGHTLWVNSKALEVNGISRETAAPRGGCIEKNPVTGELWGSLKETANNLIELPEYTVAQYAEALDVFQKKMHQFGITGVLCLGSSTFPVIFSALDELRKSGSLQLRVRGAITVNPFDDLRAQFTFIEDMQKRFSDDDLKIIAAKIFTDGVVEGGTSYILEPYTEKVGKGTDYYGEFLWDLDKLKEAFVLANQRGLQLHVHSTGDASTRTVLDALEYTRTAVGEGDCRNTITHLQLVDEQDIKRFKELGVVASVQPFWHFKLPNWWDVVDYQFLGAKAEEEFPLGTFFANEVVVTSSSDYPATIVPNPLYAIEIGVTRNIDNGEFYSVADINNMDEEKYLLDKRERASVGQMLKSFTANGAYALFMERVVGSIEVGKLADMVVLDQNILAIDPVDIDKVKVVMTFFNGTPVYKGGK